MRKIKAILIFFGRGLAFFSLGYSSLIYARFRSIKAAFLLFPRLMSLALANYLAVMGGTGAALGLLFKKRWLVLAGSGGATLAAEYIRQVSKPHDGFEKAFGPDWEQKIPAGVAGRMLKQRWAWKMPGVPEPRLTQNLPFWTVPGYDRKLLCDLWQPAETVPPSGLAYIYFHGSAWFYLDKDVGTRPVFRHLTSQGHVVMDVAYRLGPETNLAGMVGDVKRAVAWMKLNAASYGVDPKRIVVAGSSAGGHLALLGAYSLNDPELTPEDVRETDTSVRGVVSFYGPTDLRELGKHAGANLTPAAPPAARFSAPGEAAKFGDKLTTRWLQLIGLGDNSPVVRYTYPEMMQFLLGGSPEEVPEMYDLAEVAFHVTAECPPTLLLHGEYDLLAPVEPTRTLYRKLLTAGVPVVYVEYPFTSHGFELVVPKYSPVARAAFYDLDRFLGLLSCSDTLVNKKEPAQEPDTGAIRV